MRKIETNMQSTSDPFVIGKPLAIICSYGATQFNGRFVRTNHGCNLCLVCPILNEADIWCRCAWVSCLVHKCSFDMAVLRGLSYTHLPLSTIKVEHVT